jgi:uncharacterized membrane protein YoaK (UPF0700 family)
MATAILVNWGLRRRLRSAYGLPLVLNAVITKISRAEIRTTHVTGLVTDAGIELGKLLYVNRSAGEAPVLANRERLRIHTLLIASFFTGGLAGALGFKFVGFACTLPLAIGLWMLTLRPLLQDLRQWGLQPER